MLLAGSLMFESLLCRCLICKCHGAALPILATDVLDVDPKKTALTVRDFQLYCYYGGMIHAGSLCKFWCLYRSDVTGVQCSTAKEDVGLSKDSFFNCTEDLAVFTLVRDAAVWRGAGAFPVRPDGPHHGAQCHHDGCLPQIYPGLPHTYRCCTLLLHRLRASPST